MSKDSSLVRITTATQLIQIKCFVLPSSCKPDDRPNIHPDCTDNEEKLYTDKCADVIMSDRFKPCHALVDPNVFRDNCVYDMCEYDGMDSTLCDNVEAYAQACQSAGVTISWRTSTFCRK